MMKYPRISVIIATHNHAQFIYECLASVRSQTYTDYELIVIDNGSTDNTREIIYSQLWEKLRYHYQDNTGSVAGPRNTGIKLASGEYVAFLDSDDLWYARKLERVMEILESDKSIDILSHALWLNVNGKRSRFLRTGPLEDDMFKALLCGNRLMGSATVVKKNVLEEIGGFDEGKEFIHAEDYEMWLRIAYKKKRFSFINEALGEYRVHGNNLSRDFETALRNEINVINKHFKNFHTPIPFYKSILYNIPLSRIHYTLAVRYLTSGRFWVGLRTLFLSWCLNPRYILEFVKGVIRKIRGFFLKCRFGI